MTPSGTSSDLTLGFVGSFASALGPVIEAVGTPRFLRALNTFIAGFADCDTLHLQRSRLDPEAPKGCRVDWIGSYCSYEDSDLQAVMALYFRRFAADDSIARYVPPERSTELVQRSSAAVADAECKRLIFDVAAIHDECQVLRTIAEAQYSISLCRSKRLPPFSVSELSRLKELGEVLLPLTYLHALQVVDAPARLEAGPSDGIFSAAAARRGVHLSQRETDICSALVKGRTLATIAETMQIKESTVKTYTKRAFAKLGIGSRRDLLSWLHEAR
ncbi:helix-turn-helix transcriptional regulator [Paraburkholderia phenazinium]|nr:helix-turn-helix transcriptional regulator [Paraburkholderia phenazinium]